MYSKCYRFSFLRPRPPLPHDILLIKPSLNEIFVLQKYNVQLIGYSVNHCSRMYTNQLHFLDSFLCLSPLPSNNSINLILCFRHHHGHSDTYLWIWCYLRYIRCYPTLATNFLYQFSLPTLLSNLLTIASHNTQSHYV